MTEQIVDIVEANMPVSSDVEAAAKGAGAAAGEYAGRQAANASLADVRALANTNKSRLDVLTAAPAAGNTELTDIRVGADGVTYSTAGDSVRAQIQQAVRSRGTSHGGKPPAPFDDMDTLPDMSVTTYYNLSTVAHAPAGVRAATVIQVDGAPDKDDTNAQLVVAESSICYRYRSNNGVWGAWHQIEPDMYLQSDTSYISATPEGVYSDLDTVPSMSVVSYAEFAAKGVANYPDGFENGSVITIAPKIDRSGVSRGPGTLQIVASPDGRLAYRVSWRTNGADTWGAWTTSSSEYMVHEYSSLSAFARIGVIGDSYASGATQNADHPNISWPVILGRLTGTTVTRYAKGGMSCRDFFTWPEGAAKLESSDPDDLYLFALGINDLRKYGAGYIGSIGDLTADPETNPDTYIGNIGKILHRIKQKNAKAKIVLLTICTSTSYNTAANQKLVNDAIIAVGQHEGLPVINLTDDPFFRSGFYLDNMPTNHPVAVTYAGMAKAIERLFSTCAQKYVKYFSDYIA